MMAGSNRKTLLRLLAFLLNHMTIKAQQSAAGQDTLIALIGRDYVMMGADSSSSGGGGIALTSSNIDKLAVIHDGMSTTSSVSRLDAALGQQSIVVGFAGDAADADRLVGTLRAHAQIRELEAGIGNDAVCVFNGQSKYYACDSEASIGTFPTSGLDSEAIAHLARSEIASRLRSRQPLQLCLLVGGMVRCNHSQNVPSTSQIQKSSSFSERVQKQVITGSESYSANSNEKRIANLQQSTLVSSSNAQHESQSNPLVIPKLFWLDQYGSLQSLSYGAHGFGSNFALSILDQRYRNDLTREEAINLISECFQQLRQRYVINSPTKPRIKCVDLCGVRKANDCDD